MQTNTITGYLTASPIKCRTDAGEPACTLSIVEKTAQYATSLKLDFLAFGSARMYSLSRLKVGDLVSIRFMIHNDALIDSVYPAIQTYRFTASRIELLVPASGYQLETA